MCIMQHNLPEGLQGTADRCPIGLGGGKGGKGVRGRGEGGEREECEREGWYQRGIVVSLRLLHLSWLDGEHHLL